MTETPGGKRVLLKEVLPLDMPMMVQIFPVYGCNFKCEYCLHGVDRSRHGYISDTAVMDMGLYRKVIHDIKRSGRKLKMLRFAAIGEPLMHKDIAEMVRLAQEERIAESVDIVTNGSLLTHELSDALINAGLSRLRISIEGLCAADYEKRCHCNVDFEHFVQELTYFYYKKSATKVYIKIIDYMVQEKADILRHHGAGLLRHLKGMAVPAPVPVQKDAPVQPPLELPADGGLAHAHGAADHVQGLHTVSASRAAQ